MKKKLVLSLLLLSNTLLLFAQYKRCGAVAYDSVRNSRYANWVLKSRTLRDSVTNYLARDRQHLRTNSVQEIIRIPVVVHVIHDNIAGQTGGRDNTNITNEQIKEQIRVLNEDYRRKINTRGFNNNSVGTDTGIEFYLANIDPNDQPTTGITRHLYREKTSFAMFGDDQLIADIVSWPTDRYLNIWTARFGNGTLLGSAQFPSIIGVDGLDNSTELQVKTDGVFIDFRVLGIGSAVVSRFYRFGRTTTHEIGHWLGLIHTWGDTNCGTDYCNDTPTCESGNQSTSCASIFSVCKDVRNRNMIENYMDYTIDSCMNIFTKDQASRMRAVLEIAPRRQSLVRYWTSQLPFGGQLGLEIFPNPASNNLNLKVTLTQFDDFTATIFDLNGKQIFQNQYTNYPSWTLTFSTRDIAPGTYIVKIQTKAETVTKRLIISR